MMQHRIVPIFLFLLLSWLPVNGQHDYDSLYNINEIFKSKIDKLANHLSIFDDNDPLEVTIRSDFKQFNKNKNNDEYHPAVIEVLMWDTIRIIREIGIKPRGNFRRKTCYYPPIKLNFKKKDMLMEEFQQFDKMKLVTTCKKSSYYDQMVVNEYLIYKAYNLISDYSLRVRLLEVTYIDESGKFKPRKVPSFLIEPVDEMTARLQCTEYKNIGIAESSINKSYSDRMAVFQYMIGNTDWSIPGLHNVKLLKHKESSDSWFYTVPYDFDYCGLVNAPYAIPPEILGISSVRERIYRGYCRTMADYKEVFKAFTTKKDEILELWIGPALSDGKYKENCISYLNDFFDTIESDKLIEREFVKKCR